MISTTTSDTRPTIAHIMPWAGVGGVEIATLRMVEMTRDRFRNVVFCLEDALILKNSLQQIGIETIDYSAPEPSFRHGRRFYAESLSVARLLTKAGAHLVHFSEIKGAYHTSLAARIAKLPMICHVRNTYPQIDWRERLALLPVDRYIFVSVEAQRRFALTIPEKNAHVIYDAIEIPEIDIEASRADVRREFAIPGDCAVVGMVARVNPQKDYFTLADAAAQVLRAHPRTRFMIVGDNAQVEMNRLHYAEVIARLRELGIADSFIFTGHRSDVSRLVAGMDISILSTHREGFGLCVAESMALRKPVVATAVGGLLEVVSDGRTGYLHAHKDSSQLASRIIDLLDDPAKAQVLADAGYEHVKSTFSRKNFVGQISAAYMEAIHAR